MHQIGFYYTDTLQNHDVSPKSLYIISQIAAVEITV